MERILEALANDDLSTMASTIKENPEYGESMKEICEIENILYAALNPTESSLLKKAGRSATGRGRIISYRPFH